MEKWGFSLLCTLDEVVDRAGVKRWTGPTLFCFVIELLRWIYGDATLSPPPPNPWKPSSSTKSGDGNRSLLFSNARFQLKGLLKGGLTSLSCHWPPPGCLLLAETPRGYITKGGRWRWIGAGAAPKINLWTWPKIVAHSVRLQKNILPIAFLKAACSQLPGWVHFNLKIRNLMY